MTAEGLKALYERGGFRRLVGGGDVHAGAVERLGGWLQDAEATGTIENTDLMPAALLARFGRATAEQVVQHVEERMASPQE